MQRRDFILNSLSAGLILSIPMLNTSCTKEDVPEKDDDGGLPPGKDLEIDLNATQYAALKTLGGHVVVNNIIVANTDSGYVALSSVCTHQGCEITYSSSNKNFPCPCHGSVFSSTGSVLTGPATTPVKKYTITQAGNVLTIKN
jgi:cytochrome b6-f complex iron-sulfur subunit